jgi:hypothetical protein
MFRKISTIILMGAIVVTGVFSFAALHYWESSVRIFQMNSDQQNFRNGRGEFDRRERHESTEGENRDFDFRDRTNLPDSLKNKFSDERNVKALPDSAKQRERRGDFRGDHGSFRGGHGGDGRGGDFRGGSSINLGKASGFLAVFALFTLITIGFDRGFKSFGSRKKSA